MITKTAKSPTRSAKSITVPFSQSEWNKFNTFLETTGQKKGFFVRQAIFEKLDRLRKDLNHGKN